jgi:N6-L-threonylcarbamoyladenine synthase
MLNLGYPGGSVIDRTAREGDPAKISFPRPYLNKSDLDFSFSGIKTAVHRYIMNHPDQYPDSIPDVAAGFQEAVVEVLTYKAIQAAQAMGCLRLALVGGVAANQRLREKLRQDAEGENISVYIPSIDLCGDNAAMIAAAGYHYIRAGIVGDIHDDVFSK